MAMRTVEAEHTRGAATDAPANAGLKVVENAEMKAVIVLEIGYNRGCLFGLWMRKRSER